jgi:hypothetical protein
MSPRQFADALQLIGLKADSFAWLTGSNEKRVRRWLSGEEPEIPPWVTLVCALLTLPGARDLAMDVVRKFSTTQGR